MSATEGHQHSLYLTCSRGNHNDNHNDSGSGSGSDGEPVSAKEQHCLKD